MRIAILSILVIFMSCASAKNTFTSTEINNLIGTVASKNIEATFNWAQPTGLSNVRGFNKLLPPGSSANNINLIGNANFFRIKNDSIHIDLPYYGEQQMSTGYTSGSGIKFEGKASETSKVYNERKGAYIIAYSVQAKDENYEIMLTLYANNKSNLNVNSSHRSNISYNGDWKELKKTSK
ncbi:DUF4251 domain-containing protein [Polaribacter sp. IC073]|uniref:DUF4251 domain-containing protein n=1 Tax=Polaribacter sp. IC073 TaxID=2508540 RepID=UPI001675839E|nr:DUF4251 domain-containing protein [Polaribacter sp. IC073]